MKYWFIDSASQTLMMLIDKGYYDYDFEKMAKQIDSMDNAKTDEEVEDRLKKFGFNFGSVEDMNAEEIQEYAMNN